MIAVWKIKNDIQHSGGTGLKIIMDDDCFSWNLRNKLLSSKLSWMMILSSKSLLGSLYRFVIDTVYFGRLLLSISRVTLVLVNGFIKRYDLPDSGQEKEMPGCVPSTKTLKFSTVLLEKSYRTAPPVLRILMLLDEKSHTAS